MKRFLSVAFALVIFIVFFIWFEKTGKDDPRPESGVGPIAPTKETTTELKPQVVEVRSNNKN